jgi:hypothetical protein
MDIPAYWALGFQLCKYNYGGLDNVKGAVDRTAQYQIPHVSPLHMNALTLTILHRVHVTFLRNRRMYNTLTAI